MITGQLLKNLAAVWQGPVVELVCGQQRYRLGADQVRAPAVIVRIKHPATLLRLLISPSLTFGEGYMRGDITLERGTLLALLEGFYRTPRPALLRAAPVPPFKQNTRRRAVKNARHHYHHPGNSFYQLWLDETMTYSCAMWENPSDNLAAAQRRKLELVCRKVRLQRGQTLLDIGCGWGSLLFHAARQYNATAVGITPSDEQANYIEQQAKRQGLAERVTVIRGDWRDLPKRTYDRVVSIGMFEHVGRAHYTLFLRQWLQQLNPGGLSLLHTIGRTQPARPDPWISRYIFPGGQLPPLSDIMHALQQTDLMVLDIENLWQHYARTLAAWHRNFTAARKTIVSEHGGPERARMWELYLQGAEAGFRWGQLSVWQIVFGTKQSPWPLDREVHLPKE